MGGLSQKMLHKWEATGQGYNLDMTWARLDITSNNSSNIKGSDDDYDIDDSAEQR